MSSTQTPQNFNVVVIGHNGRLMYEALMFCASLRHSDPDFGGRLFVAEPQPGEKWNNDPRMTEKDALTAFERLNVEILPFESTHFGRSYPYGNKIEALKALPKGEPFIFFDSDTLITGPLSQVAFDFERPSASSRVEGTWPEIELYGPKHDEIWKSLYDKFELDFDSSLDQSQPKDYWRRYLYFNAGYFYYKCPHEFGELFLNYALEILHNPPEAAALQSYDPWLDQVALPLVIHALGGGRDLVPENTLDGAVSCHYRTFPLLYARESDHVVEVLKEISAPNWIKKVVKEYAPIKKTIYHKKGEDIRAMFDQDHLPKKEQMIRNQLRKAGYWFR